MKKVVLIALIAILVAFLFERFIFRRYQSVSNRAPSAVKTGATKAGESSAATTGDSLQQANETSQQENAGIPPSSGLNDEWAAHYYTYMTPQRDNTGISPSSGLHDKWAFHIYSQCGDSYHAPVCGPLEKFKGDPQVFDYEGDGIANPTELIQAGKIKDFVRVERIGEISGFAVWNIIHDTEDSDEPERSVLNGTYPYFVLHGFGTKMIVVERNPGNFCEIFQQSFGPTNVSWTSVSIINAGDQVLATTDELQGTGGGRIEGYWTFDEDGPVPLDLLTVLQTAHELVPEGYLFYDEDPPYLLPPPPEGHVFYNDTPVPELPRPQYLNTLNFDDIACAEWEGNHHKGPCVSAHIVFKVKDHKLIVTNKSVNPAPNN
jgi:hypothetical protein